MTKEDSISLAVTFLAAMIPIYLSTYIGFPTELLLPTLLLVTGIVLQFYINFRVVHDVKISGYEATMLGQYTFLALSGLVFSSFIIPYLFKPIAPLTLSVTDQVLYGQLYAVGEERFFRGAVTSFLMWKIPNMPVVTLISGGIFAVYHLAVYGLSEAFVYVLLAGAILTYVTLKTGRLTPALLGHMINNVWSVLG